MIGELSYEIKSFNSALITTEDTHELIAAPAAKDRIIILSLTISGEADTSPGPVGDVTFQSAANTMLGPLHPGADQPFQLTDLALYLNKGEAFNALTDNLTTGAELQISGQYIVRKG